LKIKHIIPRKGEEVNMKQFALRLPKELHKILREMAYERDTSINSLIVEAVKIYIGGKK